MATVGWITTLLRAISLLVCLSLVSGSTWSEWWTYGGISGPEFWGIVNPEWALCAKGKKQSPINIEPKTLLFDPHLKHLQVGKHKVTGTLVNDGHIVKFQLEEPSPHYVNISGGPTPYSYRVSEILLHFGSVNTQGSEHTIDGQAFPAEIQILGYNSDIYGNLSQAIYSANGLIAIGVLAQVGKKPNPQLEELAQNLKDASYKGEQIRIRHVSVHDLLPDTTDYMTYEGSLTMPGCYETVTWILLNKPITITEEHLMIMRNIWKGDESNPKEQMGHNCRPVMDLNSRPIRTNINFRNPTKGCTMESNIRYQAGPRPEPPTPLSETTPGPEVEIVPQGGGGGTGVALPQNSPRGGSHTAGEEPCQEELIHTTCAASAQHSRASPRPLDSTLALALLTVCWCLSPTVIA